MTGSLGPQSAPHGQPKKRGSTFTVDPLNDLAGSTGLEPAASGVTGRRYNRLNYDPDFETFKKCPLLPNLSRQTQISILEIHPIFLRLKSSPSLTLAKIEHFSKVSSLAVGRRNRI